MYRVHVSLVLLTSRCDRSVYLVAEERRCDDQAEHGTGGSFSSSCSLQRPNHFLTTTTTTINNCDPNGKANLTHVGAFTVESFPLLAKHPPFTWHFQHPTVRSHHGPPDLMHFHFCMAARSRGNRPRAPSISQPAVCSLCCVWRAGEEKGVHGACAKTKFRWRVTDWVGKQGEDMLPSSRAWRRNRAIFLFSGTWA